MTINSDITVNQALGYTDELAARFAEPTWARDNRRAGMIAWRTLPKPQNTDEDWRRTNPDRLNPSQIPALENVVEVSPTFECQNLPEQAICLSMSQALAASRLAEQQNSLDSEQVASVSSERQLGLQKLEKCFSLAEHHQKEPFSALNAALRSGGAFVSLPAQTSCADAIHINHQANSEIDNPFFMPHSVIVMQSGSKATITEHFRSNQAAFHCVNAIELHLEPNASLHYVLVADWGNKTNSVTRLHAHLGQGASLKLIFVGLGGNQSKAFFTSDISGQDASSEYYGMIYGDRRQHIDVETLQKHHVSSASSNVLFNCAVNERAHSVFSGNIVVEQVAQKSDAYQKNRNLLLSRQAKASSMPKLEIVANDVRCTHGASFSSFDEHQIFYLQSRGMTEAEAKRLIITGFFKEIVDQIGHADTIERLDRLVQEHLDASLNRLGQVKR